MKEHGCNAAGIFSVEFETLFEYCAESCAGEGQAEVKDLSATELADLEVSYSDLRWKYYNHKAVVMNIHITHHAGTTLCLWATCNGHAAKDYKCSQPGGLSATAFTHTSEIERKLLGIYDTKYVSFEYRTFQQEDDLSKVDWQAPWVISVLVVRDPLERLLAADYTVEAKYGSVKNRTAEQWWQYATDDTYSRNYQTRILGGGVKTDALRNSQALVSKVTFVLDQHCFNANLKRLGMLFGWKAPKGFNHGPLRSRGSVTSRINNDTLLGFLEERNRDDIEFYRWARERSLVRCPP